MTRDYQDDYGRGNYRPYDRDRSQRDEGGVFDRIGNKLHQTWDRITGDDDEDSRQQQRPYTPYGEEPGRADYRDSPYGARAIGDYGSGTHYGEGGSQTGSGSGYRHSQMGRYSPQQAQGSNYGGSGSYRSGRNSSSGYSGRMSDYGGATQRSGYGNRDSPYGASGSAYGASQSDPYGSGLSHGYGESSGQGAPAGGYGRSSMGFPRGSDYSSGGPGTMGSGYFGSGAGPWGGGHYGETGRGGYTPQRSQESTSSSDYQHSRREQSRRGESGDGYGNYSDR